MYLPYVFFPGSFTSFHFIQVILLPGIRLHCAVTSWLFLEDGTRQWYSTTFIFWTQVKCPISFQSRPFHHNNSDRIMCLPVCVTPKISVHYGTGTMEWNQPETFGTPPSQRRYLHCLKSYTNSCKTNIDTNNTASVIVLVGTPAQSLPTIESSFMAATTEYVRCPTASSST